MNPSIEDKKIWHFTMDDNPNLSPDYVKSLKQMYSGVFYRRFIEGEWCVAEGMIYDMFDTKRHIRAIPDYEKQVYRYFVACDYGTSTVMTWGLYADLIDGTIYKVTEYYWDAQANRRQKTDGEFAHEFDEWLAGYPYIETKGGIWAVYVDPSAASWKEELRRKLYRVIDADNNVVNGIRVVGSMLKKDLFIMSPDCTMAESEYASYSWDPAQQEKGVDAPIKKHDHICDCDRYGLKSYLNFRLSGTY